MSDFRNRLEAFCEALVQRDIACALITVPHDVAYFTGYSHYWDDSPTMMMVAPEQQAVVIAPECARRPYPPSSDEHEIRFYENYPLHPPMDERLSLARQVADVIRLWRMSDRMVGIEFEQIPHFLVEFLTLKVHGLEFSDVAGIIQRQRTVKTEAELVALRESARVASLGQAESRRLIREGRTEIAVLAGARAAMEAEAGEPLMIAADLAIDSHVGPGGGLLMRVVRPGKTPCKPGSVIVSDLAPRVNGYWGDTCATLVIGAPTSGLRQAHLTVSEAMDLGLQAIRPGALASEVDAVVRDHLRHYGYDRDPHYGHGVGVTHFEQPILMPSNSQPLEPNMVIALEPSVPMADGGNVKLEHMVRVTESGAEVLSSHSIEL